MLLSLCTFYILQIVCVKHWSWFFSLNEFIAGTCYNLCRLHCSTVRQVHASARRGPEDWYWDDGTEYKLPPHQGLCCRRYVKLDIKKSPNILTFWILHCWGSFLFASRVKAFVPQQCLLLWLFQEQTHCAVRHAHWRLLASEQVRRASAWAAREWWHIKRIKIQAQGGMTISRTFCFWAETGKQMNAWMSAWNTFFRPSWMPWSHSCC